MGLTFTLDLQTGLIGYYNNIGVADGPAGSGAYQTNILSYHNT